MNIVMVDNLLIEQNGPRTETVLQPHLGLISLLAVLRADGHGGSLYDPKLALAAGRLALDASLYKQMALQILARNPDAVGLTSLGCNFICTIKVAQHLKSLEPDLPILLGGPHATILSKEVLERFPAIDVIVRNEAEGTILEVIRGLSGGQLAKIPGIAYRSDDRVQVNAGAPLIADLDTLPMPSYADYPIERLGLTMIRVEAGRGCPFMCTFCSTASFFGRSFRLKSARRLCQELDELSARYGLRHFSLQHDLFTVSRGKVLEFCDAVADRNYIWNCSARMDCVDAELLQQMSRAGCRKIYFGVETGSPHLQQVAKKRLDLTIFYPTLAACESAGIKPTVSFITGYPQERPVDQAATLNMIGSCFYLRQPPENVQLHLMTPEPGTELLAQYGNALAFDGFASEFNFPILEPNDGEIMSDSPDIFMNNHYFVAEMPRRRHVLVTALFYVLYDLSAPVICYLMDQFNGQLSCLTDVFDQWAAPKGLDIATAPALESFCLELLGSDHPATALVRYMNAVARMTREERPGTVDVTPVGESQKHVGQPGTVALSPDAAIIENIFDCPQLLSDLSRTHAIRCRPDISEEAPLEQPPSRRRGAVSPQRLVQQIESDWASLSRRYRPVHLSSEGLRRSDYLLMPTLDAKSVRTIAMSPNLTALLKLFEAPRPIDDFRALVCAAATNPLVEELLDLAALVPIEPSLVDPKDESVVTHRCSDSTLSIQAQNHTDFPRVQP